MALTQIDNTQTISNATYKVQTDLLSSESGIVIENGTIHLYDGDLKFHANGVINKVANASQLTVDSLNVDPVLSILNTPPGSPTLGDRHLVGTAPTGAWVTKANYIAEWDGSGWVYTTPLNDMIITNTGTSATIRYNGTLWVQWGASVILQNGNTLQATMTIGTNDNYGIKFKTNNLTRLTVATTAITSSLPLVLSQETNNTLVYLDASRAIRTLPTATYPDITELSYVKGATSSVQTQLNAKSPLNLTLDRKTASYTLVAGDNGKVIEMNVASANTLTVNASLFSAGNQIVISQYGAGQTTITAGAGVTLRSDGGKLKINTQYSIATIIFISATEAYVSGNLAV
jgi:hypothetical protein